MCTPIGAAKGADMFIGTISNVFGAINQASQLKEERKTAKYNMQVAYENAKNAKNEGYRAIQEGIESSREEKIRGLQEANKERARASAGNFNVADGTNMLNYENTLDMADANVDTIKKNSQLKANNYFEKANSYLKTSNDIAKSYNDSLFKQSQGYFLGGLSSVANKWFDNDTIFVPGKLEV